MAPCLQRKPLPSRHPPSPCWPPSRCALLDLCSAKVGALPAVAGDGHPVIGLSGLGAGSMATSQLRATCGPARFDVHDWEFGVNTGPEGAFDEWLPQLVERVRAACARQPQGQPGRLEPGRHLCARDRQALPRSVRQVLTLGTPHNAMADANHAGAIFRLLGGDTSQLTPDLVGRLRDGRRCPPPRSTARPMAWCPGAVAWSNRVPTWRTSPSAPATWACPRIPRCCASWPTGSRSRKAAGAYGAGALKRPPPSTGSSRSRSQQHDDAEGDAVPGERLEVVGGDVAQQPAHAQPGAREREQQADRNIGRSSALSDARSLTGCTHPRRSASGWPGRTRSRSPPCATGPAACRR